jgi:hypothetical protein
LLTPRTGRPDPWWQAGLDETLEQQTLELLCADP